MDYKYFGLLATVLLTVGLLFVVYRWPQGRHKTFSQHVALRRSSAVYYSLLFLLVLPILVLFFVRWFTPYFGITPWLNALLILAALFQIACTFIPETGGRKTSWHQAFAGLSALLLMPAVALLLFYATITSPFKLLVGASLLIMLGCTYLVIKTRGNPRNFLFIQCAYYAAFLLPIMLLSYLQTPVVLPAP